MAGRSGRPSQPLARVALRRDLRAPRPVREVPVDRFREARLERFGRPPSELALELRAVDRVPPVMARPVRDEIDQVGVTLSVLAGSPGVKERADELHGLQVGALVKAAYVVGLANAAELQHESDRPAMVLDV